MENNNSFCIKHNFDHWNFINHKDTIAFGYPNNAIGKYCKNCPKILTVKEFMMMKKKAKAITEKARVYIDLFWG